MPDWRTHREIRDKLERGGYCNRRESAAAARGGAQGGADAAAARGRGGSGGPGPAALARHEELAAALSRIAEQLERLRRLGEKIHREEVRRYLVERARAELEVGGDMQRCLFYAYSACFTPESVRCRVECAGWLLNAMYRGKWITDEEFSRVARLQIEGRVEEFIDEVCGLIERFRRDWEATVEDERRRGLGGRGARVPPPWCKKEERERRAG